ncbi:unnamed protein product [Tuber aestivum]|uniref:Uncharacterized protein n=1 Tax=Tuber aestivum TaxID=59557 RepID=A0A292Q0Y5_9PEZI|nr:unnamed protein product [Tuber aestivum]
MENFRDRERASCFLCEWFRDCLTRMAGKNISITLPCPLTHTGADTSTHPSAPELIQPCNTLPSSRLILILSKPPLNRMPSPQLPQRPPLGTTSPNDKHRICAPFPLSLTKADRQMRRFKKTHNASPENSNVIFGFWHHRNLLRNLCGHILSIILLSFPRATVW